MSENPGDMGSCFQHFWDSIRMLAKTSHCSKQTPSMVDGHEFVLLSGSCPDNAALFNGWGSRLFAKIEPWKSLHFCRPPCQCVGNFAWGRFEVWEALGRAFFIEVLPTCCGVHLVASIMWVRKFGSPVCASEWKESQNSPSRASPLQVLLLPLKMILSSSEVCPKQFGIFPKISGKISKHLQLLCPPTFRVSRPSEVFSLLFRAFFVTLRSFFRYLFGHFSLLSDRFSEHFPLHFGYFPWHLRPRCRYTFGPLWYTCRLSARSLPSTFCRTTPKQATAEWRAKCQSSLWSLCRYNIGHIQH